MLLYQSLLEEVNKLKKEIEFYKFDSLTELMLRKDFEKYIEVALHNLRAHNIVFSVAIVDVNNLHRVNREKGYTAGDMYIKSISNELIKHFQKDSIFRIGGDEFAIIQTGVCDKEFINKLKKIKNIEFGYTCVTKDTDIDSIIKLCDDVIIEKKRKNNFRRITDKDKKNVSK